ncbi:hypothetical protein [Flavihumibacter sp. ZG627]|uniref:hypothetical protein n=1 Tax=Flavihumibacter sp. ZG627 TaxID=1463156 RepID=UPI0005804E0F|nr:hypothetical protein [Flavihumibacter sp. ZG627]KIC90279.1 hypothetical protein HY58_09895 [Flavihumibacter sp. ZG627]
MSYILYGLYNVIYQIGTIAFLFFANTYLNSFVIPDSLKWRDGKLREDLGGLATAQTIILLVEAALLMLLMFYINKRFLFGVVKEDNANSIALWTAGVYSVITVAFIVFLIYTAFK